MAKPTWDNPIDKHTAWDGDISTGYKPVSGTPIEGFIKSTLESKIGCVYYDELRAKYLMFADAENRDLYLSDRVEYADLLLASFDAPAPYTIQVTTATNSPVEKGILAGTTAIPLDFTFQILDSTQSVVRDSVLITYTFRNSGVVKSTTKVFSSGETASILVDDFLSVGTNEITIRIEGRSTGAEKTVVYSWTVIQLDLSTSFSIARSIGASDGLAIPYQIAGLGTKTVEFYIDGVKHSVDDVIVDATKDKTFYISQTFTPGKHTLQLRAYTSFQNTNFFSTTLYREFVVTGGSGKYATIALDFPPGTVIAADKSNLIIQTEQYVSTQLHWGYYSSDGLQAIVNWRVDGTSVASREVSNVTAEVDTAPAPISFMPTETGSHTLEAVVYSGNQMVIIGSFNVNVIANTSGVREATDGITLRLTALGRSNEEPSDEISNWSYGSGASPITTTFTNMQWSDLSGWKDDALVLTGTSQATINYKPLSIPSLPAVTYGSTVEIEFETFNVEDDNAVVAQIFAGGHGIKLTANKASITSVGSNELYTNYKENERMKLAFIINRNTGVHERRLTYIQNNGILERACEYSLSDSYSTDANIILGNGNSQAGIKIYSIRCYSRALSTDEEFYNFIVDSTDAAAKVQANDVYVPGTTRVSLEKMQGKLPVLTFTGPMHILLQSSSKTTEIHCDISFVNPFDPTRNFTIEQGRVKLQGTSSLGYPRKNFKIYMKKDDAITRNYLGEIITDWQMKDGAVPCHTFTLKADFSDSSCTHNSTIARMYGDIEPNVVVGGTRVLRTPPQLVAENEYVQAVGHEFPYQLRTTPDSFPMVCFYREEYGDDWIFMGQYNFLNDKGNDFLYGFRSIYAADDPWDKTATKLWDNVNTHCFEVLNNTDSTGLCTWTDSSVFFGTNPDTGLSYWEDTFESRYPEFDDVDPAVKPLPEWKTEHDVEAQSLYALHNWASTCYKLDNGGVIAKQAFENTMSQHLNLYFTASYYSYYMRFGGVDQVNKNMMMTTYDGVHFFPIRYDNDTILGQRNDTRLVYDYTITRQSIDPETGDYAYAGHSSWLWNALEASDIFMNLVSQVDTALYSAGLTYEKTVEYFDETSSDLWCERIYNDNGKYKYIEPLLDSQNPQNYIQALQGKRQSHRHWWLRNRFDLFDAYFLSGEYTDKAIRLTVPGTPQGSQFQIKAGKQNYYGWGFAKTPQETGVLLQKGGTHSFTLPRDAAVGDPVYIYAATSLQEVDLSVFTSHFTNAIDISGCYDETLGTSLKKLILGSTTETNNASLTFSGFSNMSRLEYLDIQGLTQVHSFPLTGMTSLTTFKALGSGLTNFTCPAGLHFTLLELPQTVASFVLEQVSWTTLTYTPTNGLTYVDFTKMQGANVQNFISTWVEAIKAAGNDFANKTLKLSVPKAEPWTDVPVSLMLDIAQFGTKDIRGKFNFSSITSEQVTALTAAYGPNVWNADSPLVFDATEGILISCSSDNIVAGNNYQLSIIKFPVGSASPSVTFSINGITPSTDASGNIVYIDRNVTLYRDTGVLQVDEDSTATHNITVLGVDNMSELSTSVTLTINARTYPSSVTVASVNGPKITSTGLFEFTATFNVPSFTGTMTSATWTITTVEGVSINTQNASKMYLRVSQLPAEFTNVVVTFTANFLGRGPVVGQYTVQIHQPYDIAVAQGEVSSAGFCNICHSKGISASSTHVLDTEARSWIGTGELIIDQSLYPELHITNLTAAPDANPWYTYFALCDRLDLSLPYATDAIDISTCANYTYVDLEGCYVEGQSATIPSITLGPNVTTAKIGKCPVIKCSHGKIFTENHLTCDIDSITGVEFDNCPFTL